MKTIAIRPFIPAIVWALAILALSTKAGIQMPANVLAPDKIGHFAAYGVLTWLVSWALKKTGHYSNQTALLTVVCTSLYGAALEWVQWAFFPNRFFEVWDMVANFLGAIMYYLLDRIFTTQN